MSVSLWQTIETEDIQQLWVCDVQIRGMLVWLFKALFFIIIISDEMIILLWMFVSRIWITMLSFILANYQRLGPNNYNKSISLPFWLHLPSDPKIPLSKPVFVTSCTLVLLQE